MLRGASIILVGVIFLIEFSLSTPDCVEIDDATVCDRRAECLWDSNMTYAVDKEGTCVGATKSRQEVDANQRRDDQSGETLSLFMDFLA